MSADGGRRINTPPPWHKSPATDLRKPPHNIEAEQALLGAIFVNNKAHERVSDFLRPEHFAEGIHGRIYAAASRLIEQGRTASPVTLKGLFDQDQALADMGGAAYLVRLATCAVTLFNTRDYGETIADLWRRRQIIEAAQEAIEGATTHTLDGTARDVQEILEQRLSGLHDMRRDTGPRLLVDLAGEAIASADAAYKNGGRPQGIISTGLADLDRMLGGGLSPSDLIYLAGRPSMGKSALAGSIALAAARAGHPVFLASPEMSGEQIAARALSARSHIASHKIRSGDLQPYDFQNMIAVAAEEFSKLPLVVDDTAAISLPQLRQRFRRFVSQAPRMKGVATINGKPAGAMLIIDYVGLMDLTSRDRRGSNRNEDLTVLSQGLKQTAKEFGVPVVALSQLSRAVEARDNKRPMLSDLRDSGSLEQDADVVGFVFREEYYLSREEPARKDGEAPEKWQTRLNDWQQRIDAATNTAELIVAKQRNGATGKVTLHFDPLTCNFTDLARGTA
jgi:replicative DNA helicase